MKRIILCLCMLPWTALAAGNIVTNGGSISTVAKQDSIILCGQSFNATTGYVGPGVARYLGGVTDMTMGGTACDALDSTTEATADAPIATNFPAFNVHGLYCRISSDPASDVVLTVRSAAADLSATFTCTIAGTGTATSCTTTNATPSAVAAAATIAVKVVTLEDLSLQDVWCKLFFSIN